MRDITPAILEKSYNEIKGKITSLREKTKFIHIDFCDGLAVPTQTWPFATGGFEDYDFARIYNEEDGLPYWDEFDFEFDLMVEQAVENFDIYMKLGPRRVIFHLMAQPNTEEFENFVESLDMYVRDTVEIGLAFRPSDDLDTVMRISHKVDFVHVMGHDKVGTQGEGAYFTDEAIENIKFLRQNLPGVVISADIGINTENAELLFEAGADRLAVGSAIWKSTDPLGTLETLQSFTE